MLSPPRQQGVEAWCTSLNTQLKALTGADASTILLPDRPFPRALSHDVSGAVWRSGFEEGRRLDPGWWQRHDLHHAVGLTLEEDWAQGAGLMLHWRTPVAPTNHGSAAALMKLLLPVFRSGMSALVRFARQRRELAAVLDQLPNAVLLYHAGGRLLHTNRVGQELLRDEPARNRIRVAAQQLSSGLVAWSRPRGNGQEMPLISADVVTASARYRLEISRAWPDLLASSECIVVSVEGSQLPADLAGTLRTSYRLTSRESEVAEMIADGCSNRSIAQRLKISGSTARRHTEQVLLKLGVNTRTKVAVLIAREFPPRPPAQTPGLHGRGRR